MNRRDFLKYSFATTASVSAGFGMGLPASSVLAMTGNDLVKRNLINTMLIGGADLRYLFVPSPGSSYAEKFWEARMAIYNSDTTYDNYDSVWKDLYLPTTHNGFTFGIHKHAAWLKQQFDLGNAAIIANVIGSSNRRHDHSQLIMNTGDPATSQYNLNRDGWGGRFAYTIGSANTVSVTQNISIFCNGIDARNRNAKVIHARDTRNFALVPADATNTPKSAMARALKNYYFSKRRETRDMPPNWPYRKFLQHEQALRQFGDALNARLNSVQPVRPDSLRMLYDRNSSDTNLNSTYFGQQCANVYDSFIAAELFQLRIASMEYGSWDTHKRQKPLIGNNLEDIFGNNKGLDTLTQELANIEGAVDNTVFVFTSDFGRQLRANGDNGTDHGRGSYMILVGNAVNGGTYGEMFPDSEIELINGESRYDKVGADIEGRTSFERVLAEACDWAHPGSGVQVFPNTAKNDLSVYPDGPILEAGVDLSKLFA